MYVLSDQLSTATSKNPSDVITYKRDNTKSPLL